MTKRKKPLGRCLLTGVEGPLVKSHIIPRFVADKALGQAHRIQFGEEGRPQLLFNSWADNTIVVAQGEKRLADIDTAAARIFRSLGLSWRHFPLTADAKRAQIGAFDSELITIPVAMEDAVALRLFFLSILWRCAVSSRVEFAEIFLDRAATEKLRRIILGLEQPGDSDFPIVLVLLTSQGEPQVHSPLAQTIDMKELGFDLPNVPIFRFFFDGLIVHMGRQLNDKGLLEAWGSRVVGTKSELILIGRPYDGSSQEMNLGHLKRTLFEEHPEQAIRIYRTLWEIDARNGKE
ncbi:hypothetical protein [Mesorhizobium australicum]|uniref:hypothetical protein n=1 Tax=Mesorhizobium australicum TaxID=536018 RepID=UPI000A1CC56D|nr:hypothetical protein [Mesorhizobium australicum]